MQKRAWKIYLLVGVATVATLCLAIGMRLAFAADWQEEYNRCIAGSDAPNMVTGVCRNVADAWVNGDARASENRWISDISGANNNLIKASENDQDIIAVYRLRSYSGSYGIYGKTPGNYSYYNWFGASSNQQDPGRALSWIQFVNAGDANMLWRGVVGNINTWNVGGNADVRISVPGFKEYVESHNGDGTVGIAQNDDGSQTYWADVSINGCWETIGITEYIYGRHYYGDGGYYDCGGGTTRVRLKISPSHETREGGEFRSISSVSVEGQSSTSDENGKTTLEVETDKEDVTVSFWHNLKYYNKFAWPDPTGIFIIGSDWSVNNTGSGAKSGRWVANAKVNTTSSAIGREDVSIHLEVGESVTVCRRIDYNKEFVTIGYTINPATGGPLSGSFTVSYNGAYWSEACAVVVRNEEFLSGYENGEFKSKSSVTIPVQNDILSELAIESDYDGEATLKFSTDAEVTTVKFSHTMYYWNYFTWRSIDVFSGDNTDTRWKIREKNTLSGDWSFSPFSITSSPESHGPIGGDEVQVKLGRGEMKKVCRRNVYTHKHVKYYWSGYESSGFTYVVDSYDGSDDDHSMACVEITRPSDPGTHDDPGTASTVGRSSTGVMMAGEDSTVGWNSSAKGFETRRLRSYEAVRFDVMSTVAYAPGNVAGMARYAGTSVCNKFPNKTVCSVLHKDVYPDSPTSRNESVIYEDSIVVPDMVGSKVCAAIGWEYEYWVGYIKTDSGGRSTEKWDHLNQDYWYIHKAACSTVAKKPSAAVWNAGLFTNGGVVASRSYRYLSYGGRDLFGSWVEHLLVAGKAADTMGSGAALSYGGKSNNDQICSNGNNNALLTISNVDCGRLGYSEIASNTTLRVRLRSYLRDKASDLTVNTIGGNGWMGLNGTMIYNATGDVTITGNITTNPGPYRSIYDLPQVVLFVDGNVNIESSVTEIDAWIIATGMINTCSSFVDGKTTADTVGLSGDTCTKQLIFNGPVMAERIKLNRSFGSDPLVSRYGILGDHSERYSPGEIFNLRADTYLWAYAQSTRYESSFTETYTRELAPRY